MIRAVYGGSFDPFHNGHVSIITEVLRRGLADIVHVAPAGLSPGKTAPRAGADDRLQMARRGLDDLEPELSGRAVVEALETRREGPSYTAGRYPGATWKLVMGADALAGFDRWRRPERILEMAGLIVFSRPGPEPSLRSRPGDRMHFLDDFSMPVSSTDIRARLAEGADVSADLPAGVLEHRRTNGLYSSRTGA